MLEAAVLRAGRLPGAQACGLIAATLALSACGGDDDEPTPAAAPPALSPTPSGTAAAPPGVAPGQDPNATPAAGGPILLSKGKLGRPVELTASSQGRPKTRLEVRLIRVIDPVRATAFERESLPKGRRFVGVRLSLRNAGNSSWAGYPGLIGTLITRSDEQATSTGQAGPCGGAFSQKAEISPRRRQVGCLAFTVPRRERLRSFQFSPDFPASPGAEWALPRR